MKKKITIGNITKVKWHYRNAKYGYQAWGHMRATFDESCKTITTYPSGQSVVRIDDLMNPVKFYAYVEINKDNKLHIRNLFDSKHEKGLEQKNAYFRDEIYYDLFLDDTSNLLDAYLALGNVKRDDNWILHFCVEYEPTTNIDLDLILYCSQLEQIKSGLEDKLKIIDIQKDMEINKKKTSWFKYSIGNPFW
jgi:hypothetical protein